jgi:Na+-transporting methylmalonyl-CoA/oxaloacetate decarboxylase gamma subunit
MMVMDSVFLMFTGLIAVIALFAGAVALVIFRMSLAYRQQFAEERALERSMEKHMQIAARREQKRQAIRAERRAQRSRSHMAHA